MIMFDSREDGEGGGREAGVAVPPVITEASPPCATEFDLMLCLRVVRWVMRHYANDFGTFDFEQQESALVNRLRTRWSKTTTTDGLRAAVKALAEMGAFHLYARPPLPTSRSRASVWMLRPSRVGCKAAQDQLMQMRRASPPTGRTKATFVPNYMAFALDEHGVPADQRRAAAQYLIDHVVRPYLEGLGYARLPRDPELDNAPRGPVVVTPPVVAAQQALAAPST